MDEEIAGEIKMIYNELNSPDREKHLTFKISTTSAITIASHTTNCAVPNRCNPFWSVDRRLMKGRDKTIVALDSSPVNLVVIGERSPLPFGI